MLVKKKKMKKVLRKYLSVERRDLWDGPNEYLFSGLSVDKLKYMLKHKAKKDLRIKKAIEEQLSYTLGDRNKGKTEVF